MLSPRRQKSSPLCHAVAVEDIVAAVAAIAEASKAETDLEPLVATTSEEATNVHISKSARKLKRVREELIRTVTRETTDAKSLTRTHGSISFTMPRDHSTTIKSKYLLKQKYHPLFPRNKERRTPIRLLLRSIKVRLLHKLMPSMRRFVLSGKRRRRL